jgi:hypothetical protein
MKLKKELRAVKELNEQERKKREDDHHHGSSRSSQQHHQHHQHHQTSNTSASGRKNTLVLMQSLKVSKISAKKLWKTDLKVLFCIKYKIRKEKLEEFSFQFLEKL